MEAKIKVTQRMLNKSIMDDLGGFRYFLAIRVTHYE